MNDELTNENIAATELTDKDIFLEVVKSKYEDYIAPRNHIYEIFKDFFGEENVDMKPLSIEEFVGLYSKTIYDYRCTDMDSAIANCDEYNMDKILAIAFENTVDSEETSDNMHLWDLKAPSDYEGSDWFGYIVNCITFLFAHNWHGMEEECVDSSIYVYFKESTVTNESGNSHLIKDVYIKVPINAVGTFGGEKFFLGRATFTFDEFRANYVFSHSHKGYFNDFSECCTGNTDTPISKTIRTLECDYDEDMWQLFCLQLSQYVTIESKEGVPYISLEVIDSVNRSQSRYPVNPYPQTSEFLLRQIGVNTIHQLRDFLIWFFENKELPITIIDGTLSIALNYIDLMVIISKAMQEYRGTHNTEAGFNNLLVNATIDGGKVYYLLSGSNVQDSIMCANSFNSSNYTLLKFKGESIHCKVTDIKEGTNDSSRFLLINQKAMDFIYSYLFNLINYAGRETEQQLNKRVTIIQN